MGPPGIQAATQKGGGGWFAKCFDDLVVGNRLAPAPALGYRDFLAIDCTAAQWRIDLAPGALRHPPDDRLILTLEAAITTMSRELLAQSAMRGIVLGNNHEPTCILIEAMNDAGPS